MTDIQAHLRFLPMSAQKVRLVVDLVRGRGANEALEMLRFVPKAAALPVRKLLLNRNLNLIQCQRSKTGKHLIIQFISFNILRAGN